MLQVCKLSCHVPSLTPSFQDTQIQGNLTCYREGKGEISTATSDVLAMFRHREKFAKAGGRFFFKYMLTIDVTDKIIIYRF